MVKFTGPDQTVKPGGVVQFTEAIVIGNSNAVHREGSGVITLPAVGCPMMGSGYELSFSANIGIPSEVPTGETAATAPVSLAFAIGGEPDADTTMEAFPAAADNLFNVSRDTIVTNIGGCCASASIENTSAGTVFVGKPILIVKGVI